MSTGDGRARTYGGWQREKTEFIFGLSGRRAALLAAAVLAGILPIATTRISEAIIFWPAAVICVAAVFIRIAGRTTDEWAASALSYALLMFRGHHKFVSGPFTASTSAADGEEPMDLPGILAPVRLLSVPAGGRDVAVACHRYDRTYTAVARVRFAGIGLADSGSREQRVAGWGGLLAGLCTEASPLIRVQALQRIVPEPGVALRSWHEAHADPHAPELAQRVTGELMSRATLATSRREAYLAFTMDEHRARTAIRGAGGGETGAVAVLLRHLHALGQAIGGADLEVEDWLGAGTWPRSSRPPTTRGQPARWLRAAPRTPPGAHAAPPPRSCQEWRRDWPDRSMRKRNPARTCTTGRSRSPTGCRTGHGRRRGARHWPRCWPAGPRAGR
jgi:hypothetical protein